MITKLINEKYNILLWISLQIQIKEKLIKFPDYYFEILEEYDNYQIFINKKINNENSDINSSSSSSTINFDIVNDNKIENEEITKNELIRKKILHYRYNNIYVSPDEFLNQFEILENEWLEKLEIHQNIKIEIDSLKKEYLSKKENIINEENEIPFKKKLDYERKLNSKLKLELERLKSEKKKSIKEINIRNLYTLNINKKNINNINLSPIHKNNNNFFLNIFSNPKKNLFSLIIDLLNMVKQNNFIKFAKKNQREKII